MSGPSFPAITHTQTSFSLQVPVPLCFSAKVLSNLALSKWHSPTQLCWKQRQIYKCPRNKGTCIEADINGGVRPAQNNLSFSGKGLKTLEWRVSGRICVTWSNPASRPQRIGSVVSTWPIPGQSKISREFLMQNRAKASTILWCQNREAQ